MTEANMTIKEVAQRMECAEQKIRIGLQQKRLPFGSAVYNEQAKTWSYHISRASFWQYQYGYIPEILKEPYEPENTNIERRVS